MIYEAGHDLAIYIKEEKKNAISLHGGGGGGREGKEDRSIGSVGS